MKNKVALYFIFLVHLVTLSIDIHFSNFIKTLYNKDIPFKVINEFLSNKLNLNLTINDGNINLNSIIYFLLFFIIGFNTRNKILFIVLSFILLDGLIFYFERKTNMIVNISFSILGYIFGVYFNNRHKNKLLEKNRINYDEENYEFI